ncbi:MAG: condensation domain-containing protein [Mobilitalea sp.]
MDIRLKTERTHYYSPSINIVMVVTIGGKPSENELRSAIHKALEKHAMFNSKVYQDEKGDSFYSIIAKGINKIETRDSVGEEDWKQIIQEQERIAFDFINGELIRFFILRKNDSLQLIIVAHHLAGDALAITYLIRDIMTALDKPSRPFPKLPIELFYDEKMPKDVTMYPLLSLWLKKSNRSWNKNKRVFQYEEYLSMFQALWRKRQTAVENSIISGADLKNLLEKCKENKVTINSAIVTAFLLAVKNEKEAGMAVSIRPDGYEGMGNFASGVSVKYKPNQKKTFWENASRVQAGIYKRLNNNRRKYFIIKFQNMIEPTLIDAAFFSAVTDFDNKVAAKFATVLGLNGNTRGIGVTNLARVGIPSVYGKYSIQRIVFVAPIVLYSKRIIGVVTLADEMSITMQYVVKKDSKELRENFEEAVKLLCTVANEI